MRSRNHQPDVRILLTLTVIVSLLAVPSFGESQGTEEPGDFASEIEELAADSVASPAGSSSATTDQPASEPSEPRERGPLSKLSVHGFLTQAYAKADYVDMPLAADGTPVGPTPTGEEIAIGIPEEGTFNYHFLALQFRYQITPKDIFIVQFSSRALGTSPVGIVEDEIELDWAFYERRLGDNTSVKVGRVQIPFGIYNEVRDVGTVLPFYRPAYGFYGEGSFTSETIDGLAFAHTFAADSNWALDATLFGGQYETFQIELRNPDNVALATQEDAFGVQLWQNTPNPDLRIGLGYHQRKTTGGLFFPPGTKSDTLTLMHASLDWTFGRFTLRSEFLRSDSTFSQGPFFFDEFWREGFYVELGARLTSAFHIWAIYDHLELEFTDTAQFTRPNRTDVRTDLGVAFNYFFAPNLVLKGEYHETEEEGLIGFAPVPLPEGLKFEPLFWQADDGNYLIISMSVSF